MPKCVNCPEDATIEYRIGADNSVFYCAQDAPRFLLRPEFQHMSVPVVAEPEPVAETPTKKKSTKTSTEETTPTEPPAEAEGE